jgi:Xaa-Pro aminopeptidase
VTTEIEEKTERLTRLAHANELGGVLLASQPGFAWLTGGRSNRIDGSRENGSGALFVRADGRRFVIANAIEMPRLLAEELEAGYFTPIEYPWTLDHAEPETVARLARDASEGATPIGADIAVPGTLPMDMAIARARALLHPDEASRYRQLGADAGRAVGDFCRMLPPGSTELEVARGVQDVAAAIGGRAIVTLVAADDRIAAFRHPVPTSQRWTRMLMVVVCIQRNGLVVALSRLVAAAPLPDDLRVRTDACAMVFGRLLAATRAGASGRELFLTAQRAYADATFPGEDARHHQGGAIAYRSREWIAHPASAELVQERQAFAWNPTVTGSKAEDTALLTDGRIEIITRSPGWPAVGDATDILLI